MSTDRITQLRIRGMRAVESLDLDVTGLRVLIGDNGAGKSTIVEALELLRHAAKPISHIPDIVVKRHGDLRSLLRRGSQELTLGISIEGGGPRIDYDFTMAFVGNVAHLDASSDSGGETAAMGAQALALPWHGLASQPAVKRLVAALGAIRLHVPFETRPLWQARELSINTGPRWPSIVEPTRELSRFGINLPSAFYVLRNSGDEVWQRVLERARLGLGADVRDLRASAVGRGNIELEVLFGAFPDAPVPAEQLSDGQIAYLCFVALCEFHAESSLLAFDEPEIHLHPELLARVTWMLEEASTTAPILLATHSDRLLDALEDPASAVRICELDERRALRLRCLDRARLTEWLKDYRGFGALRGDGYAPQVLAPLGNTREKC